MLLGGAAAAARPCSSPTARRRRRVVRLAQRALLAGRQPQRAPPAGAGDRRPALGGPPVAALRGLPAAPPGGRPAAGRRDAAPVGARRGRGVAGRDRQRSADRLAGARAAERARPSPPSPARCEGRRRRVCAACGQATVGNPLLLRELLRAVESERVEPTPRTPARSASSPRRRRAVLLRLARLPEPTRSPAPSRCWATARMPLTARRPRRADGARDRRARRAEILRSKAPLGFIHPLVREAVYLDMPRASARSCTPAPELLHAAAHRPSGSPRTLCRARAGVGGRHAQRGRPASLGKGAADSAVASSSARWTSRRRPSAASRR